MAFQKTHTAPHRSQRSLLPVVLVCAVLFGLLVSASAIAVTFVERAAEPAHTVTASAAAVSAVSTQSAHARQLTASRGK